MTPMVSKLKSWDQYSQSWNRCDCMCSSQLWEKFIQKIVTKGVVNCERITIQTLLAIKEWVLVNIETSEIDIWTFFLLDSRLVVVGFFYFCQFLHWQNLGIKAQELYQLAEHLHVFWQKLVMQGYIVLCWNSTSYCKKTQKYSELHLSNECFF